MQDPETNDEGKKPSWIQKFKKNMQDKKIKQHIDQNKYWYGIGGAVIANTAVTLIATRKLKLVINNSVAPNIAPVFNNTPVFNNINTVANNIGRPPYLVYIEELDKFVRSQGEAAKAIGASSPEVSQYFSRGMDAINGYHLLRYKELV